MAARLQAVHAATRQFRFTDAFAEGRLTDEQRQFYEENGYMVVRGLVPQADLDRYRERFEQLCTGEVERPATMLLMRDIAARQRPIRSQEDVTKAQDFYDEPVLFSFCEKPEILEYVKCFTGPDVHVMHTMLINKPPGVGKTGRHPLHQDLLYFPFRPADKIVCAWAAMEPVNRDNGCLVVLPGTHKSVLKEHGYPDWTSEGGANKLYHGIKELSQEEFDKRIHLEMGPGDVVFFHPLLFHGSGANTTKGYRKAISGHYASSFCHYIDVKDTLQEELAKETTELAMKKFGADAEPEFHEIWRFKGRCVAGQHGNLT